MTDTRTDQPMVEGTLPLYTDAQLVRAESHADIGIKPGATGFGFAATTPMIPITVDEFERAALDYPIVFMGETKRAFAVTGLDADRNLFVNEDGTYRTGAYVPAYLRRYPFVFARNDDDTMRMLCLDAASDRVGTVGEEGVVALFADGQPSEATTHALEFCRQFDVAEHRTTAFATLLGELDLLVPRQAHANGADGQPATLLLDHFVIDRERLDALTPEQRETLATPRALGPVYAAVLSEANWQALDALKAQARSAS